MKKYYLFIVVAIVMVTWFLWQVFNPPKNPDPNIYYFKGKVKSIVKSNNHDFGIIVIQLDTAHITVKDSSFVVPNGKHFPPFRYHGNIGEVYCTISLETNTNVIGYKILSDTVTKSVEILNGVNDTISRSSMLPIFEETDKNYIINNSLFKGNVLYVWVQGDVH